MAVLEKLFEPVFKKSDPSPVRSRHKIPARVAGFGICCFFLLLPPGATQCRVSFVPGAELGHGVKGQQRAETTLDFLKQQQRAPYFPTLVLQVTLVIRLCLAVSSNLRTQFLSGIAFGFFILLTFLPSRRTSLPTTQCTEKKPGHKLDLAAMKEQAHSSFQTGKNLQCV